MASIKILLSVESQKHFGDDSVKVVQDCFCSERSIDHSEQLTVVLEGVIGSPVMGLYPDW